MKAKNLSRRQFLALAGVVGGSTVLAACGAPAAPPPAPTAAPQAAAPAATEVPKPTEAAKATAVPPPTAAPAAASKSTIAVSVWVPTEWTERSAEHPTVTNAPRILQKKFKDVEPNIEVKFQPLQLKDGATDTDIGTFFSAMVAAGNEPDISPASHEIPIQNNWALPIEDFLALPNPYAPKYKSWMDVFYPSLMKSLVFGDGHTYCAPIQEPYPGVEVGMAYNKEWFSKLNLKPPTNWTEELEVCKALKDAGNGMSPWPPEAKEGNVWPVALQLLISMLQPECAKMDKNGDKFVGADEGLPGYRDGLTGPLTEKYKAAWMQMKKLAGYWVDGWATSDLDAQWRDGKIGYRTTGAWEFQAQKSDPLMKFERGLQPMPYVTSKDVPGGGDPTEFTKGDGTVPGDLVTAINGPDTCIMKVVQKRNTTDAAVKWLQWLTTPENDAFLVNENQGGIPTSPDAKLGPLFTDIASFKVPKWPYQIAWWGEGLYWDNTQFNELRKIFVGWMTGQMDDATFFQRQEAEAQAGSKRYEDAINAQKK
jgi:hypothetical protein